MKFQLLLILALMFTFSFQASAITSVAMDDVESTTLTLTGEKQNVFNKIGNWFQKQRNKAVAYIVKKAMAIDFEDPATILKYAIIAYLVGVAAMVLGSFIFYPLWYLGYLLAFAGTLLFFYWIYIKFLK